MTRPDILIIGAGLSGIAMALEARRQGFDDILILEKADDFGGTWRENTYPGVACDIPSHLYALAGHPNPDWRRRYAGGAEIQDYIRRVVHQEGLDRITRFGARFTGSDWDAAEGCWRVRTAGGGSVVARVVIPAMGPLHVPRVPDLPGLAGFEGAVFHSAEWDHAVRLEGRDVALVGAGASAAQLLPHVARAARRLTLYQRSPPWVLPHFDLALPGPVRALYRALPPLVRLDRAATFGVQELKHRVFRGDRVASGLVGGIANWHRRRGLRDRAMAARLAPDYHIGCKRILLTNDWYPTLRRSNVEVVTGQIAEVRPDAIVGGDGIARPAEVLILATGFRAIDTVAAMPFRGLGGRSLPQVWQCGAAAYLGAAVTGFPNLFFLLGPNTALGHNSVVLMAEAQARHIGRVLAEMRAGGIAAVEPRPEVQAGYATMVQDRLASTVWQTGGCTSWYKDAGGHNPTIWPGTVREFSRQADRAGIDAYRPVTAG